MKILIADDEPNIVLSLEYLLRRQGYQVFIARDGQEALEVALREEPEALLLDVMMPHMDGYEVCRRLRLESWAGKIIFLSAKARPEDLNEGYAAGADYYFSKPFSTRKLVAKLRELLD